MRAYRAFICVLTMTFLFCSGVFAQSTGGQMAQRRKLDFAGGLLARGMYDMAEREYGAFLEEYPESEFAPTAKFQLGMVHFLQNDYTRASETFSGYLMEYPVSQEFFMAKLRLGQSKYFLGQMEQASDLLRRAAGGLEDPNSKALAEYYRASSLFGAGDLPAAREVAREALSRHERTGYGDQLRVLLADILRLSGEREEAMELYEITALRAHSPQMADTAKLMMARMLISEGQKVPAEELIDEVLSEEGRLYGEALLAKVRLKLGEGELNEAVELAESGKHKVSLTDRARLELLAGNGYLRLGQFDKAYDIFSSVSEQDLPAQILERAYIQRVWTLLESGDFSRALDKSEELSRKELAPVAFSEDGLAETAYLHARALSGSDRRDEAIAAYEDVRTSYPDSVFAREALFDSVWLFEELNRPEEAVNAVEEYLELYPNDDRAFEMFFKRAELYMASGEHGKAERASRQAVEALKGTPEEGAMRYQLAQSLFQQGDAREALEELDKVTARFGDELIGQHALFLKGRVLASIGQVDAAQESYSAIIDEGPGPLYLESLHQLGFMLYQEGRPDEAANTYLELISQEEDLQRVDADIYIWTAEHFFVIEEYRKAEKALELLEKGHPERKSSPPVTYLYADVSMFSGELERASSLYSEVQRLTAEDDPYHQRAIFGTARVKELKGEEDEAVRLYEEALGHGDDPYTQLRARYYRASNMMRKDLYEEAASEFMMIAILFDDTDFVPSALLKASRAFSALGDEKKAVDAIEELKTRYPGSSEAREALDQ